MVKENTGYSRPTNVKRYVQKAQSYFANYGSGKGRKEIDDTMPVPSSRHRTALHHECEPVTGRINGLVF